MIQEEGDRPKSPLSSSEIMQCPEYQSNHINKNGHKKGKQNYICVNCGRQFIEVYEPLRGYSEEMKREGLKMSVNGLGFRAIERVKNVYRSTLLILMEELSVIQSLNKCSDIQFDY
jgi:transposase-like protein